jgi:hypothetical protein
MPSESKVICALSLHNKSLPQAHRAFGETEETEEFVPYFMTPKTALSRH